MGYSLRKAVACSLTVIFLSFASPVAHSDTTTPKGLIEVFHDDLLSVMKEGKSLGIKGRYDRILTYIDKYFHMPLMVMFVTGEHWQNAPREARKSILRAARRFSAGEMAVLFSSYSGETFETDGARSIQDKSVLVETSLVRPDDSPVKVIYRVKKFHDSWRIIDVLLDGSISQLLKRRGEYRRTLANDGISGLTDLLNQKAEEMLADKTN